MLAIALRAVLLFLLIIAAMRTMGKRQLGELQPAELVVTILVSEVAAIPMQDLNQPLLAGIIPIMVIISLEILLSLLSLRSTAARRLIEGRPMIVIENGRPDQQVMKTLRITVHDLLEQLRLAGIFDLTSVRFAIMETNGKLSVLQASASDDSSVPELFEVVVCDGKLQRHSLQRLDLTTQAVKSILRQEEVSLDEVFLMQLSPSGRFRIVLKEGGERP